MSGSQSVDRALQLLALIGREPAGGLPLVEIVAQDLRREPLVAGAQGGLIGGQEAVHIVVG
ncbi:MAG: hypothetical protein B7Z14_09445, partial [Bosea sp. 32-68-6]